MPNGNIVIITKIEGFITAGIDVTLYNRNTKQPIETLTSDINGVVTFGGLVEDVPDFFAVAFPPTTYNALIFDKLIAYVSDI